MTHSTRKNYKAKLEALQAELPFDHKEAVQALEQQSDLNATSVAERAKIYSLVKQIGENAMSGVTVLDEYQNMHGLIFPLARHSVDTKLTQLDMFLILRRTKRIIELLFDRVGVLSEAYTNLREKHEILGMNATLLRPGIEKIQAQYLESSIIGARPTSEEYRTAMNNEDSKFERFGLQYESTDESDSENEDSALVTRGQASPSNDNRITLRN